METTCAPLAAKKCLPCEGGVPALTADEAAKLLAQTPQWAIAADGKSIARKWTARDFMAGVDFLQRVALLAEEEQHHPDFKLAGYRNVEIVIWTHAVGGLTENDFILAAKIDGLPVELKKPSKK